MNVAAVVRMRGGIARRDQILAAGARPAAIAAAWRSGAIVRVRRAWYAVPETPLDHRIAVAMGGRIGAVSAARSYGLWVGEDHDIHVSWSPHGNVAKLGRRMEFPHSTEFGGRRIVSHWRILRETEPTQQLWRESLEQSLAQVLIRCDRPLAVAVVDSALNTKMLAPHQLDAIVARMPGRVRQLLPVIDGRADSGLESIARLWLSDQGLPFVVHPQRCGLEVDLLVGRSLIIELDGRQFHSSTEAFERDRHRDNILESAGYIVIRFSYQQVMFEWESCVSRIRLHVQRGDHLRIIGAGV